MKASKFVAKDPLEQFVYLAAHDLREPLRIIIGFTDLLAREYSDRLDDVGKNYMAINQKAARKMEAMLGDLLDYGRLGQSIGDAEPVDCTEMVHEARLSLSAMIQTTNAVITCAALPVVVGQRLHLSRLFYNLIANALKYQPAEQAPRIRITAEDKGAQWQIAVADNGIGIKPDYLQTIFMPFKRLHSDQEYTGTGLGLSICQRIVEGWGGSIWAESAIGKGSVFYFTLPR